MTSRHTNVTESIFHVNWDGHNHRFNGAGHAYIKIWRPHFKKASSHVEKTVINRLLDFWGVLDNFEINCFTMYNVQVSWLNLIYSLQLSICHIKTGEWFS
jgi:hypothetical protein